MKEWIDVSHSLPKRFERVLVFSDGYIYLKYFGGGIFYDGDEICYCPVGEIKNVTHWMPLPNPPEKPQS